MSTNEPLTITEAAEALRLPKQTLRHILQRPDRRARLLHAYRNTKKGLKTVELVPVDLLEELAHSFPPASDALPEPEDGDGDDIAGEPATLEPSGSTANNPEQTADVDPDDESVPDIVSPTQAFGRAADVGTAATAAPEVVNKIPAPAAAPAEPPAETSGHPAAQTSLVEPPAPTEIKLGSVSQQTGDAMMIVATYERLLAEREARLLEMHAALESERGNARRLADALSAAQDALSKAQESLTTALQEPADPEPEPLSASGPFSGPEAPPVLEPENQIAEPVPEVPSPLPRGFWARVLNRW